MKTNIFLCLILGCTGLYGQTLGQKIKQVNTDVLFGYVYSQDGLMIDDLQGDIALCKSITHTGVKIISEIAQLKMPQSGLKDRMYEEGIKKYPQFVIPEDMSNPHDAEDYKMAQKLDSIRTATIKSCGREKTYKIAPLKVDDFVSMLRQVVSEEIGSYPMTEGKIHSWTKGLTNSSYLVKCPFTIQGPKILAMLSTGVSYRYARTGKEEILAAEISKAPLRSLYPHDVFRMSYRINEGNIYLSLLTIENLFSRHWTDTERESRLVTTRLAHITNDEEGDNFGTWYHLFGVMVFGYAHGSTLSWSAGVVEGLGSGIASGFRSETQENKINRLGGRIGGKFGRLVRHGRLFKKFTSDDRWTDPKVYLNLVEHDCSRK